MRFSSRTWMTVAILYTSYIVYGTLLPFDFSFSIELIEKGLGNIEWVERYGKYFYTTKNIDAIANFAFFIPLGIILYNLGIASGKSYRPMINISIVTLLGLILSSSIEFLQLLLKERTTSYIDVLMNSVGCFSGSIIAYTLPKVFSTVNMYKVRKKLRDLPGFILILPILIAGFFLTERLSTFFLRSDKIGDKIFNWKFIVEPIWIWQILFYFIPLGMVINWLIKRSKTAENQLIVNIFSFFIAFFIFAILELLKFLIYSDLPSYPSIFFCITGIIIGIALSEIMGKEKSQIGDTARQHSMAILVLLVFFFISLVTYKFSYPFQLSFDRSDIIEKSVFFLMSWYSIIPFTGIQKLFIYSLQNILLFIPLGVLLQELKYYLGSSNKGKLILIIAIFLTLFPIIIQIVNHHQIPFLYEIPTNALGISLGYAVWASLREAVDTNDTYEV